MSTSTTTLDQHHHEPQHSRGRIVLITLGVMLSLFMASMEATVVATAMPTIVTQLGGLEIYSWAFSAYLLASTTTVPIYGKLSDLYGRRPVYTVAMSLFLIGSLLCGRASSMIQLVIFRAVQGLGAGGLLPLAFIIIGDIFSLEQRARMQGVFSGVWGISSIVGPLLGGFLVDQISWHWVFYINLIPGLLAGALVWFAWLDRPRPSKQVAVDYLGATLLSAGVVCLLLGLFELGSATSWLLIGLALTLLVALVPIERRAADPILPLPLFRDRLFAVACAHGLLAGWAMFGSASFVPLFVQAVLGTSATQAGVTLTPQMLGWVSASIIGSRLLLRLGYRTLALTGMTLLTLSMFLMSQIGVTTPQWLLMIYMAMSGIGMGLSIPAFLIAVQSTVRREQLGTATSTVQFSRSMGGTLGVSIMGALLSLQLATRLAAQGLDPRSVSVDQLLEPLPGAGLDLAANGAMRLALAGAIGTIFLVAFLAAAAGLIATTFAPRGRIDQLAEARRATTPSTPPAAAPSERPGVSRAS
ncbi:MDR family MFS transporter [Kallotenue papyrolyticum]|uniref:MDR family MFS transporter n=1 Tax=Kallotenue papyrolyticum TaxID=1325125 RepID=UPI000478583D|nr:MDR family MFS transporter [Kallotenue papyrolyticum]